MLMQLALLGTMWLHQSSHPIVQVHHGLAVADVSLNPSVDPAVCISVKGKVIWRDVPREWHPWKLAVMDVEGDGKQEFVVALHKLTRHRSQRLHTLFVYGFDGAKVYPKWRGSTMGRDFVDFAILPARGGDRIVTLDLLLDGGYALACHAWDGFGFRKLWERGHWTAAKLSTTAHGVEIHTDGGLREYNADGEILRESQ